MTAPGLALLRLAFITCPIRKLMEAALPTLYSSPSLGLVVAPGANGLWRFK